jgi:SAM-dependent methyltransferase
MADARLPARTMLEHGTLPYARLAAFAEREGRRPRAIYQAHKWFARRLGSAFRTLLVGAVSKPTVDFWRAYYEEADLRGVTVLDPFVGGGTSLFEAQRLGANAVGVDVDPIACAITRLEARAAQLPDLGSTLGHLREQVGAALAPFHQTLTPDGVPATILHHFWVQRVACAKCGEENEAHPSYVLAEADAIAWAICATCGYVFGAPAGRKMARCGSCGDRTDLRKGAVSNGTLTCRACGHADALIEVGRRTMRPPEWHLFAVEAFDPASRRSPVPVAKRVLFAARTRERELYASASAAFEARHRAAADWTPDASIRRKRSDVRLVDYGYQRWSDLFNARQLLHLSLLGEAIAGLDEPVRGAMAMAFSNHLATNCMMTAYAGGWRRLTPLFSVRAFRHIPRPVELNPWSDGTGRGSFPNAVRQLKRAATFARAPQEPKPRGGFRPTVSLGPKRAPNIVCGTACDLNFQSEGSVDLVLTDPPYFDNVAYSELADFYAPWLEQFGIIPTERERRRTTRKTLKGRRGDPASALAFAGELGEAFAETARVLRPNGLLVFTFRHSTPEAWNAMGIALAKGGLRPVQVLPLPGEIGVGLHAHAGTAMWDAVLVFRKLPRVPNLDGSLNERLIARSEAHAGAWRRKLARSAVPFGEADGLNLRRATLVAASLGLFGAHRSTPAISLLNALRS